jgi:hypothetical protein
MSGNMEGVSMVSMRDIAWAAGFIEGEGSFYDSPGKTSPSARGRTSLSASQVDPWCLSRLVDIFGGVIYGPWPNGGMGKRSIYRWNTWGSRAIGIMMTIYSFMSPRRQSQIESVIHGWRIRGASRGERHAGVRIPDTEALAAMRRVLVGEAVEVVAWDIRATASILYNWLAGKSRPYLARQLEAEGFCVEQRIFPDGHIVRLRRSDEEILSAMHRVCNGEPVSKVAASLGVKPGVLSNWMAGTHRPKLVAKLRMEKEPSTWGYKRRQSSPSPTDETLLIAMRCVATGESIYAAAKRLHIHRDTLSGCLSGKTRPHLLAQLQQEETGVTKED